MKNKLIIIFSLLIIVIFSLIALNRNNSQGIIKLDNKDNSKQLIEISNQEFKKLEKKKENFILYVYENCGCNTVVPFSKIVNEFIEKNNMSIYSMEFKNLTNSSLENNIKYFPTIIIFNKGKIFKYLKPDSDADLIYYESYEEFEKWIATYVDINNNRK